MEKEEKLFTDVTVGTIFAFDLYHTDSTGKRTLYPVLTRLDLEDEKQHLDLGDFMDLDSDLNPEWETWEVVLRVRQFAEACFKRMVYGLTDRRFVLTLKGYFSEGGEPIDTSDEALIASNVEFDEYLVQQGIVRILYEIQTTPQE